MIRIGEYKGIMGKVERRREVANGDDWYLVRLDNELTGLYRRTQLDDAQDMMDCIASMDTSTETSEQSKAAASEQSEAASESPRTSAAATAMVTTHTGAVGQTGAAAEQPAACKRLTEEPAAKRQRVDDDDLGCL